MTDIPNDPHTVVAAMEAAGWEIVGHRSGAHIRMGWPASQRSTVVPLDPNAPEYRELMGAVLAELNRAATDGAKARQVLDAVDPRAALWSKLHVHGWECPDDCDVTWAEDVPAQAAP